MVNFRWIFGFFCLFMLAQIGQAQVNLKVGVSTSYVLAGDHNAILNQFNSDYAQIVEKELPDLHFMTGVHFGIRYRMDQWGVDLSFQNLRRTRETFGETDSGGLFQKKYYYSINALTLSMEYSTNPILSYGLGIGPRTVQIKRNIASSDKRKSILEKDKYQWTVKAYLLFEFGGSTFTRFAIRPYFDYPLSNISLDNFIDNLALSTNYNGEKSDSFSAVGLSFIFYNGRQ